MSANADAVKTFLISLLGGSRVQIGGPTGAFVVIVSGIVLKYGVDGLVVATLMAGFILIAFGLLRLGGAIKFIPFPVTIGFTSGIALIIFSSQIRDLLGLEMQSVPSAFLPKWDAYVHAFDTVNPWALVVAVAAFAIILVWPKISARIPGPFVALIVTTALAQLLHLPVETIGARFGEIHAGLPAPRIPHLSLAITLLLITLFFGRWAGLIPLATLAAILVVVAFHMSEWRTFIAEFRAPKSDVAVLLTTFLLTVLVDLTVAIEVGMVLAAFLFMRRMAEVTNISVLTHEFEDPTDDFENDPNAVRRRVIPEGVQVYEITGPFFFGAAELFKDRVGRIAGKPKVLILRMRHVPAIDSTGLHALRDLVRRSRQEGTLVVLADVHAQPIVALERSGFLDEIGEDNVTGNVDDALNRAREFLGLAPEPRPVFATPTVARETPAMGTPIPPEA